MTQTPPGWYPDQRGDRRWWDGERWTEHVQEPASAAPPAPPAASPPTVAPPSWQPGAQRPGQAPGQPSWQVSGQAPGQPSWQPQRPPPRRRGPLIAGIVVAVLVIVGAGIGAFLLLRDDGGGGSPDDDPSESSGELDPAATEAMTAFFDEVVDGDCAALDRLTPDALGDRDRATCEEQTGIVYFGAVSLEGCQLEVVAGKMLDDETARVAYDITGCADGTRNVEETVTLRLVDGAWLLDDAPGFLG